MAQNAKGQIATSRRANRQRAEARQAKVLPTGRSRCGLVTARALRFGLHPTGRPEREAEVLAVLARHDAEVLDIARRRLAGGGGPRPLALQVEPDAGGADARAAGAPVALADTDPLPLDRVRAHALEVLALAEAQLRGRPAA